VSRCTTPRTEQAACSNVTSALSVQNATFSDGGFSLFCDTDLDGCSDRVRRSGGVQGLDYFFTATPVECAQACDYYNSKISSSTAGGPAAAYCNVATWVSGIVDTAILDSYANCFLKVLKDTCHEPAAYGVQGTPPRFATGTKGAFLLVRKSPNNQCAPFRWFCQSFQEL
jgi:hypothetical protein